MRSLPFPVEAAAGLLRENSTMGAPLLLIALCAYGDELFGDEEQGIPPMDPIELFARIQEDFRVVLSEQLENRYNAILMAVSTDAFYEDPVVFASVANALSDGDVGDLVDGTLELTVPEALMAVYEVGLCREEGDETPLSNAVLALIDGLVKQEAAELDEQGSAHYDVYIREQKMDLASQLHQLGYTLPIAELTT